jgi:hypothetical protein
MFRSKVGSARAFRGNFGVDSDIYKRYGNEGPRTSVGEWSDREPGYAQSVDRRWSETEGGFGAPDEQQASRAIRNQTRRSAVRAASRYQWSQGRSDGRSFGRRQAAMADRVMREGNEGSAAEAIAQY